MADTLEIESVAQTLPQCHRDQSPKGPQGVVGTTGSTDAPHRDALTDEERKRMLDEVEKQQQDFGIQ